MQKFKKYPSIMHVYVSAANNEISVADLIWDDMLFMQMANRWVQLRFHPSFGVTGIRSTKGLNCTHSLTVNSWRMRRLPIQNAVVFRSSTTLSMLREITMEEFLSTTSTIFCYQFSKAVLKSAVMYWILPDFINSTLNLALSFWEVLNCLMLL